MKQATTIFVTGFFMAAAGLQAQDEAVLRHYLEGREVAVKIDMPGDVGGIDIFPEKEQPVDYRHVGDHLKRFGTSVRKGTTTMITKVHVKKNLIELQFGGGGYGTFSDRGSEPSVPSTYVSKSQREKDLESQRNSTSDDSRKRSIDRELSRLRSDRQREESRLRSEAAVAKSLKAQVEMDRRMQSGSRFNIRWANQVPQDALTPEGLMATVSSYVTFTGGGAAPAPAVNTSFGGQPRGTPDPLSLRKGMPETDVNAMFGDPQKRNVKRVEGMDVIDSSYALPDAELTAQFVNGVLTKFAIIGK